MVDLAHPDVKGRLLQLIMEKMLPVALTRSMRACKEFLKTVDENKDKFNCPFLSRHLCFEIEPVDYFLSFYFWPPQKPEMTGDTAESSLVTVYVDCVIWDKETNTHQRNRVNIFSKTDLVTFLEKNLSDFSIFRYGTILFHFKKESVMLRVLAAMKKYSFRCEEMFYAVCPSLPLAIATLLPKKIGCNSQANVTMIQSTSRRSLPIILERVTLHVFQFSLPAVIEDVLDKTVKVELMSAIYSPACYHFILKIMKKLIEEDHSTIELWATLMGAPLPARNFLSQLGEHIFVTSNQEIIVAVVKKDRVVTMQAIQSPCRKSVNLIVRRHQDMADFLSFYSFVCSGLNRHVLDKLVKRLTKHLNSLKM